MGYPIDYSTVKAMAWYPIGLRAISLLAIKRALNWDDAQIKEMGKNAPKYSLITKLMLRYFANPDIIAPRAGTYWHKNYSVGSLEGKVIDHSAIIRLRDFLIHPILCTYLEGYFACVLSMIVGQDNKLSVEETKCMHRGDEHHEFLLRW
jgi:hypothetical protein